MKKAALIGLAILAGIIVLALVLPPFINLGAYKSRYLPLTEQALQRKVDVRDVRLTLIPAPSIKMTALTVSDNPKFSKDPFFTAEQFRLRLQFLPLLRGQFLVTEFILEKPLIKLIKAPDGTFNYADIAKKKDAPPKKPEPPEARPPAKLSELVPSKIRVEGGEIAFQTVGQKPLLIQGIDLLLDDFSTSRPFPYRIALKPAGLKPVTLEGDLSYNESKSTLTLKENRLKAQDVDFAVNGSIADVTTAPRLNLTLANDKFETKPVFELLAAAGLTPKTMELSGPMGLKAALTGPSNALNSQVNAEFKGLQLNDSRSIKGTILGKTALSFILGGEKPLVQTLRGNGNVAVKDGALINVDLIGKIQQITGLIGVPADQQKGATTFRTLESDFTIAGGIAHIKRLYMDSPSMQANGGGRMTLTSPSLDLGLDVALSPEISARAGSGRAATFFKDSQGRVVVPLKVTGPVNGPSVALDNAKVIQKGGGQLLEKGAGSVFDRLLKKK
jgi:AsmA protein